MPPRPRRTVEVLGVAVDALTTDDVLATVTRIMEEEGHELILNVNIHAMNLAYSRPWMRRLLNDATCVFCDGAGVMLGARMLGHRVPERITWRDFAWPFARLCAREGYSLFLLGDQAHVVEEAAESLRQRQPTLRVVGTHHGFFDKSAGSEETLRVIEEINRLRPDILVVGFGMPLQELWLEQNWPLLEAHVGMTCGGALRVLAGRAHDCPPWMARIGLEWLARLAHEPRRVWRRYLIGNPLFVWRVVKQRLRSAFRPKKKSPSPGR